MYYLIEWHRGTPTVPPVGAVNVPAENPKIQKIHIFEDFWGHFFLINHIGFSLKYVIPKSSTDFFSSKTKSFSNVFHFLCFYHISSPISESFIAQLLLHRALDQKYRFFSHFWQIPIPTFCQCSVVKKSRLRRAKSTNLHGF